MGRLTEIISTGNAILCLLNRTLPDLDETRGVGCWGLLLGVHHRTFELLALTTLEWLPFEWLPNRFNALRLTDYN